MQERDLRHDPAETKSTPVYRYRVYHKHLKMVSRHNMRFEILSTIYRL
jgi:hypothetical protein